METKCPSTVEWINKCLFIQFLTFYIARKMSELLLQKKNMIRKNYPNAKKKKKYILCAFLQVQKQRNLEIKLWG